MDVVTESILTDNKNLLFSDIAPNVIAAYVKYFSERFSNVYTELGVYTGSRVTNKSVIQGYISDIIKKYGSVLSPKMLSDIFKNGISGGYGNDGESFTIRTLTDWINQFLAKQHSDKQSSYKSRSPETMDPEPMFKAISESAKSLGEGGASIGILLDIVINTERMRPLREYIEKVYLIEVNGQNKTKLLNILLKKDS